MAFALFGVCVCVLVNYHHHHRDGDVCRSRPQRDAAFSSSFFLYSCVDEELASGSFIQITINSFSFFFVCWGGGVVFLCKSSSFFFCCVRPCSPGVALYPTHCAYDR